MAVIGAALVLLGFFLPWVHGSAEFAASDFSGLDLARLVRNFEIVASSSNEAGGLRATAIVLYAMPALAINAAVLAWWPLERKIGGICVVAGALYASFILGVVALFSVAAWSELERVLGAPAYGYWFSAAGAASLAGAGGALLWRRS